MPFWNKPRITPRAFVLFSDPTRYVSQYLVLFGLIILSLAILTLQYIRTDWREQLSFYILDIVVVPVVSTADKISHTFNNTIDNITSLVVVKEQMQQLAIENEQLRYLQNFAHQLQEENRALRRLMNFPRDYVRSYVSARVFADGGGSYARSLLLDVGSLQGIEKGQAVLAGSALVGRVVDAADNWSRILLINDVNSMIPVISRWQRETSLLVGSDTELLKLDLVHANHGFKVGQQLMTSGEGGAMPADIPVAIVEKVERNQVFARPIASAKRDGMVVVVNYLTKDNPVPPQFTDKR